MDEAIAQLIDVIEKLESRINSYWNFFTVIIVANIGWVYAVGSKLGDNRYYIIAGLLVFFVANFFVLGAAIRRVVAFESELNAVAMKNDFMSTALQHELSRNTMPGRLVSSCALHLIIDIVVILAVWFK